MERKIFDHTKSICPECMRVLDADIYFENGDTKIARTCPEHGEFVGTHMFDKEWLYRKTMKMFERVNPIPCKIGGNGKLVCPCEKHRSKPKILLVNFTGKCNLSCPICYWGGKMNTKIAEMSIDDLENLVDMYNFSETITITGGEPTVREDIFDVIKLIKSKKKKVNLQTNGVKTSDEEFVKKLKKAGVDGIAIGFDGFDAKRQKRLRGRDTIPYILNSIENFRKYKIPFFLSAIFSEDNLDKMKDVVRFSVKSGAHALQIKDVYYSEKNPKTYGLKKIGLAKIISKFCEEFDVPFEEILNCTDFVYKGSKILNYVYTGMYRKARCDFIFYLDLKNGRIQKTNRSMDFKVKYNISKILSNRFVLPILKLLRKPLNTMILNSAKDYYIWENEVLTPIVFYSQMSKYNLDLRFVESCPNLHTDVTKRLIPACVERLS
jgi:pyruvate-formate lyase-activating enzyme